MVRTSQKTIYCTDLTMHLLTGQKYTPLANTTLNEKFNLNTTSIIPDGEYPKLRYFCIGVGGISPMQGDGAYITSEHSPIDAALFQHIPFIIRPVGNDLTTAERSNYRMRVLTTIAGAQYACYYIKVLPDLEIPEYINTINTVTPTTDNDLTYHTLAMFDTNDSSILSPVPNNRVLDVSKINTTTKITKIGKFTLEFTEADLTEMTNAMKILGYNYSTVKEIGLCTGYDLQTDLGYEIIQAQIMFHIGIEFELTIKLNTDATIKRIIELGGEEPLVR